MSRIGNKVIEIPKGVEVKISADQIVVKGARGQLSKPVHNQIDLKLENNLIFVTRKADTKKVRALHGLYRALVYNMIKGVSEGFQKVLELNGVGYRAAKQGKNLIVQVGYSHPVEFEPYEGIEFVIEGTNKIMIKGYDKEKVGQLAAAIRMCREVEPYKGKGIKYEGEQVRRKAGKAAKSASAG